MALLDDIVFGCWDVYPQNALDQGTLIDQGTLLLIV